MSARFVAALSLSHLRAHKALAMVLDGRPVVLFGANGAGKTTILEAVSLLSPGRGLRGAGPEDLARLPERLGWKLTARLGPEAAGSEIEMEARPGQTRQVRVDGKASTASALAGLVRIVWLTPAMDRLWLEGAEGRRRFLDRLTLGFTPSHAAASAAYDRAMRERNRLLRDNIRDPGWHDALEMQMARAGAAMAAARAAALERILSARDAAAAPGFPAADLRLGGPAEAQVRRRKAGGRGG
ncbi:MAG: DNA replication and repair protein RecF, partial [Rhodobacteraceae bacterium]|nr:DNA replication and repair protein RecF [Paracoccaceae bacterium]